MYWAVLLDEESKNELLDRIPPKHPNVYGEHMTITFQPNKKLDAELMELLGKEIEVYIISVHSDEKGQAVGAYSTEIDRKDRGIGHITISCANGTKPVYSNDLLEKDLKNELICTIKPFRLLGKIAKYDHGKWLY